MQLDVFNTKGEKVSKIKLRDDVFAVPANEAVVHQALVAQLANNRQGTVDTQTRGEVKRSSRKLHAQKHTGRARRGAADSPLLVGGGITFGPHPRSFRQQLPKKMRRLAIKSCLSDKAGAGQLTIVDKFGVEQPRTKDVEGILIALGIGTKVLIATNKGDENLIISARNLEGVKTVPVVQLNVADLLSYKTLLMSTDSVKVIEQLWGDKDSMEKTPAKAK